MVDGGPHPPGLPATPDSVGVAPGAADAPDPPGADEDGAPQGGPTPVVTLADAERRARRLRPRPLEVEFTGTADGYFRVWIVNLCLTLLTLGLFSAWAKVRRKRYFASHTLIDGSPFQYLGRPLPILKGRLIAAALFAAWYFTTTFRMGGLPWVLGVGVVLAPWMVSRTLAFNARSTAWRNVTFDFRSTYWETARWLLGSALFLWITCGLALPWVRARYYRNVLGRARFGGRRVRFFANGQDFLRIDVISVTVAVAGAAFGAWLWAGLVGPSDTEGEFYLGLGMVYLAPFGVSVYREAETQAVVWRNTDVGPLRFQAKMRTGELLYLYATNGVGILLSLGLLIPWASVRLARYRARCFSVTQTGPWGRTSGPTAAEAVVGGAAGAEVADLFDFDLAV